MKKTALSVITLVALAALYLLAWPVPIAPVVWDAPAAPGYTGPHAVNTKLANLQMIDLKGEVGPEHIQFGPDGKLYTTVASGNILRMNADGSDQQVFANTGGRVLGFDHCIATRIEVPERMPFMPRVIGENNKHEAKIARMKAEIPGVASASDADLRQTMGDNARRYALSSFDIENIGERFLGVIAG